MKTLNILKNTSSAIVVDHSTGNVESIPNTRPDIDWMWIAPEDMELRYKNDKNETITLNVSKNDIVIRFYKYDYTVNDVVVVKNNKWKENIINKKLTEDKMQLEKEAWAYKKTSCCDCDDCDPCVSCKLC